MYTNVEEQTKKNGKTCTINTHMDGSGIYFGVYLYIFNYTLFGARMTPVPIVFRSERKIQPNQDAHIALFLRSFVP